MIVDTDIGQIIDINEWNVCTRYPFSFTDLQNSTHFYSLTDIPDAPINCSVVNQSSNSIKIACITPFDQQFKDDELIYQLEAWGHNRLLQNTSK